MIHEYNEVFLKGEADSSHRLWGRSILGIRLMTHIKLFIKGIAIGIGGVSPGLSGSVIMISLGLYSRTIDAIATLNKDFKNKIIFLSPIVVGMLISNIFFSRVIETLLRQYELQTRLGFFGMLIGTVPLFLAEVRRKDKLNAKHYLIMVPSFLLGLGLLLMGNVASSAETISIPLAFTLGFLGLALTIIPGFNWATFFSAIGLYGHWLTLMSFRPADFSLAIFIPALIGAIIGLFTVSKAISFLLRSAYTTTLSALFGFYLAIIPSIILDSSDYIEDVTNATTILVGIILFIIGIFFAYWCGKLAKPKVS